MPCFLIRSAVLKSKIQYSTCYRSVVNLLLTTNWTYQCNSLFITFYLFLIFHHTKETRKLGICITVSGWAKFYVASDRIHYRSFRRLVFAGNHFELTTKKQQHAHRLTQSNYRSTYTTEVWYINFYDIWPGDGSGIYYSWSRVPHGAFLCVCVASIEARWTNGWSVVGSSKMF